jgi:hypothetical protein
MTTPVVTVAPETPLNELIECLVRSEVSELPVVDASGKLVGVVSEADVIPKEAYATRRRALSLLGDLLSGRDHRGSKRWPDRRRVVVADGRAWDHQPRTRRLERHLALACPLSAISEVHRPNSTTAPPTAGRETVTKFYRLIETT